MTPGQHLDVVADFLGRPGAAIRPVGAQGSQTSTTANRRAANGICHVTNAERWHSHSQAEIGIIVSPKVAHGVGAFNLNAPTPCATFGKVYLDSIRTPVL